MIGGFVSTLRQLACEHARAVGMVFSSHAASTIAAFVSQILLVRLLPIERFGALAAALAVHAVVEGAILSRGSETALALLARNHEAPAERTETLIRQLVCVDFAWVLGCVVFYVAGLWLLAQGTGFDVALLALLSGGICAQFAWGTAKAALFVLHPPALMSRVELQFTLVSFTVSLAGILLGGAEGFCIAYGISQGLKTLLGFRALGMRPRMDVLRLSIHEDKVPMRELAVLGLAGTVRSALAQFVQQMDLILLAYMAPGAPTAHYRAAKTLASLPARAATPLWVLARRTLVKDAQGRGPSRFLASFGIVAATLGVAGGILLAPAIFFAEPILRMVFGHPYADAADAFVWLAPSAWILLVMTGWSGFYGSVSSRKATVIALYGCQAVIFVFGVVLLAPRSSVEMAIFFAALQAGLAAAFWTLLLRDSLRRSALSTDQGAP